MIYEKEEGASIASQSVRSHPLPRRALGIHAGREFERMTQLAKVKAMDHELPDVGALDD